MDNKADGIRVTPWFYGAKRDEIEAAIAASKLSGLPASQELARIKKEGTEVAFTPKNAPKPQNSSFGQGFWSAIVVVAIITVLVRLLKWLF